MSIETEKDEIETAGVLFECKEDQRLWDLAPKMLTLAKLIENAQNEVDEEIAKEIRKTADDMATDILAKYRA